MNALNVVAGPDLLTVGTQYDVLFGSLAEFYPADAVIVVRQPSAEKGGYATVRQIPMHDRDAYLRTMTELGLTERIDLSLAPRSGMDLAAYETEQELRGDKRPGSKRGRLLGRADQCLGLVAIPFDLDVAGPRHAEREDGKMPLPTWAQAQNILSAIPLAPGLVVESGGGIHAYLLLEKPLDPEQQKDVLTRISQWLEEAGAQLKVECDTGPMTATGSLRVAGTAKGKGGSDHFELTKIVPSYGQPRFSYEDIVEAFPIDLDLSRKTRTERVHADRGPVKVIEGDDVRPGTRFARALPISRLLDEVFGCEESQSGKWIYPHDDGSISSREPHGVMAEHPREAETEMLIIYGQRWIHDWDLVAADKAAGVTSWDALGGVVCAGDWALAGRIAAVIMLNDDEVDSEIDDLVELLASLHRDDWPEAVRDAYGSRVTATTITQTGQPVHSEYTPQILVEASRVNVPDPTITVDEISVAAPSSEVMIGSDLLAVIGGPDHGLWGMKPAYDGHGKQILNTDGSLVMQRGGQITTWLATRSAMTTEGGGGDEKFDVTILTANGQTTTVKDLSAADSLNAQAVWVEATKRISFALPGSTTDRNHIGNTLAMLAAESRTNRVITRRTGMSFVDGKHVMLGLVSSIDADGVTEEHLASPPRGQTAADITRPVLAQLGWDALPADEVAAAGTVPALIGIAPTEPVVGIALLGVWAAAVAGCDERTTVILDAPSGMGKSQAASCVSPLYSLAPRSAAAPPVDLEKDSMAFAFVQMRWHSGLPIWLDDARVNTESARAAETSAGLITSLVQSAFNGSSGGRGSGDGGIRTQADIACPAIMTAERLSTQTAVVNRAAVVSLGPKTIDLDSTPNHVAGLDVFTEQFAKSGLANAMGASFYRWVCEQLDERGEIAPDGKRRKGSHDSEALSAMAAWAKDRRHTHMVRWGVDRTTGNAAYLRMGWDLLYLWAESVGARHLMPSEAVVDKALTSIIGGTKDAATKADPGLRWIRAVGDFIQGARGHLVGYKGLEPKDPLERGWKQFGPDGVSPQGTKMGYISKDRRHVVLMAQGLRDAAKAMDQGLNAYSAAEMDRFLRAHCTTEFMGSNPAAKVSVRLGIDSRPRGYVVPLSALFGDEGIALVEEFAAEEDCEEF